MYFWTLLFLSKKYKKLNWCVSLFSLMLHVSSGDKGLWVWSRCLRTDNAGLTNQQTTWLRETWNYDHLFRIRLRDVSICLVLWLHQVPGYFCRDQRSQRFCTLGSMFHSVTEFENWQPSRWFRRVMVLSLLRLLLFVAGWHIQTRLCSLLF